MFTILVTNLITKQSMNLLPRVFRYALWGRHSDFYHTRVAHKNRRDVRFPMLFGMGPFSSLLDRSLHPQIYTDWVRSEFQCSPHEVCIAFCSLFFKSNPPHLHGNNTSKQSFQGSQWLHWNKVTRFKKLNVKFPMLSEIQTSKPLTSRSVPLRL